MAIDRTPVLKRCRQLGIDPAELGYSSKKESIRQPKRRRKESEYGMQLREKQKVKFIYGVLEKQFHGYFNKARKMNGVTGENLMIILESRLDNVVFRLGFARTRKEARQSVRHGHFTVNGKRVDIPSYRVKAGDVVAVGEKFRDLLPIKEALISSERFEVPGWLEVDIEKLSGNVLALPTREQISGDISPHIAGHRRGDVHRPVKGQLQLPGAVPLPKPGQRDEGGAAQAVRGQAGQQVAHGGVGGHRHGVDLCQGHAGFLAERFDHPG